jgi:DNA-damage-inducible protein D
MKHKIKLFEQKKVRTHWNAQEEKWYFSIVDVIGILTESVDPFAYWRKLKERLKKEGNQSVTDCHGLKMQAADGKKRNSRKKRRNNIKKRPACT